MPTNTSQLSSASNQSSSPTNLPYPHRHASQTRPNSAVRMEPSNQEPAFICTICWQPQPPPAKSKLLGTSARIVCRDCWRAVLDLSICWVCGECIVRGDEVVSLGWCFWHKDCFGCLVCGTGICVPKVGTEEEDESEPDTEEAEGGWGTWKHDRSGGRRRCVGIELEDIPLCNACNIETAGESRHQVLQRGIDTVSRSDGGLSRDRLLMMSEDDSLRVSERRRLQSPRRSKAKSCQGTSATSSREQLKERAQCEEEEKIPLLQDIAAMGVSNDFAISEVHYHSDSEQPHFDNLKPEIFVSILDPFKDPPLIPSRTERQPQWMDLLPNNVYREREQRELGPGIPDSGYRRAIQAQCESKAEREEELSTLGRRPSWSGAGIQVMIGDDPTSVSSQPGSGTITPTQVNHNGAMLTPTGQIISPVESMATPCMTLLVVDGLSATPKNCSADEFSFIASRYSSTTESLSTMHSAADTPQPEKIRRTTISFNPKLKREIVLGPLDDPFSRGKRCQTIECVYTTTEPSTAPPPTERTPFPRIPDPSIDPKNVDYFTSNSKTAPAPMPATTPPPKDKEFCRQADDKLYAKRRSRRSNAPSPECHNTGASLAPDLKLAPPVLSKSSEYLERYKPSTPALNPNIEKYVARPPQPVLEKMKMRRAVISGSTRGLGDFKTELESLLSRKQESKEGM